MPFLPTSDWKKITPILKASGEGQVVTKIQIGDDFDFLEAVGVFSESASGELTDTGREIFESLFIRRDERHVEVLRGLLLQFPPTLAIQQYLWGVKKIHVEQVLTVLKTTGLWMYESNEPLTHFLNLLNQVGIITYSKKMREVKVLISPDAPRVPKSVFIDPKRPFSNIMWIKRVLGECEGYIYWLDKHFQKEALEWLWSTADANKIKEIRILSLDMEEKNLSKEAKKSYAMLKRELSVKGISLTWSVIDSKLVRDSHDRWIFDGVGYLRNVPNVNAISSGQNSEMLQSENYEEVVTLFDAYWKQSTEVVA